jgi:hypothetical protein
VDTGRPGNTVVLPYLDAPAPVQSNLVYGAAFLAAWDALESRLGGPVLVESRPEIADGLNRAAASSALAEGRDWFALAGFTGEGIIDRINQEIRRRWRNAEPPMLESPDDPSEIWCHAVMRKICEFSHPFSGFAEPMSFRSGGADTAVPVLAFGLHGLEVSGNPVAVGRDQRIASQVTIVDYRSEDDFVVSLRLAEPAGDRLLLARTPNLSSFADACRDVLRRERAGKRAGKREPLAVMDTLYIPRISFAVVESYDELLGRHLVNPGFGEYFFRRVRHDVGFALDETGARTSSRGEIRLVKSRPPRNLSFLEPFLLCLAEADADEPYLALRVVDTELLVKPE